MMSTPSASMKKTHKTQPPPTTTTIPRRSISIRSTRPSSSIRILTPLLLRLPLPHS
jgi:hypothetical protein